MSARRRVILTGAAGFLGKHIARELLDRDHYVYGVDDCRSGQAFPDISKWWPEKEGASKVWAHVMSIREFTRKMSEHRELRPDLTNVTIVHAAAHADIRSNWDGKKGELGRKELVEDVEETVRLLEWSMLGRKVPVIYLSTLAVYGSEAYAPHVEFATQPTSPYAASKAACEGFVRAYAKAAGAPWYVLRLASAVGAYYHHGHIADFVRKAKAGDRVVPLSNPMSVKSFVHAKDVARIVADAVDERIPQGTHNVAGGPWRVYDTMRAMGLPFENEAELAKLADEGWIGDARILASSYTLRNGPVLQIADGVRDALEWLGWKGVERG